jgi:MFS family permease
MTDLLPERRRAEGIGYWGMSTMTAIAVAPGLGFWMYRFGWGWLCAEVALLNLVMFAIARRLREITATADRPKDAFFGRHMVEWRVLWVAMALFLCSFGYGGIMSFVAVLAEEHGIAPKSIFFTAFAVVVLGTRLFSGRLADRIGPRRVFLPCLALVTVGITLTAVARSRGELVFAAVIFGLGLGNMYPAFVAHIFKHVNPARRGAAFGSILAAFDTGIGAGSIALGAVAGHLGLRGAFGAAAALSAFAIPYFLWAERRFLLREAAPAGPKSNREITGQGTDIELS